MVLITGRQLEHWHTGAMTRRSGALDAIEPEPVASLHPLDLEGSSASSRAKWSPSNRGAARSRSTRAPTPARRAARCSFRSAFYEAAANLLTNPVLDPFGKIPEFKYCAVKVKGRRAARATPATAKGVHCRSFTRNNTDPEQDEN